MRFTHPELPGRAVRLAYCMNLHPAEEVEGVLEGVRSIALPLRERLAPGEGFGVGVWFAHGVARELARTEGRAFAALAAEHGLDAFTANAFPYGGFHREGLKRGVFEPTWAEPARADFTADVVAALVACAPPGEGGHLSVSTHAGRFGAWGADDERERRACARALCGAALALERIAESRGRRVVLALEAEPRSSANDSAELADFRAWVAREVAGEVAAESGVAPGRVERALARHLGTCLDACHAAVEFEEPEEAFERATRGGAPLGKIQFTSALRLADPGSDERGRERLLAMAEPVYLHQVTGRAPGGPVRALDLPELARALEAEPEPWLACDEWRCHFHVPVDLERAAEGGRLGTTRDFADELLACALCRPDRWGSDELHVEIETYTWSVLSGARPDPAALVDGLEREYRHVLARLATAGWERSARAPGAR